MTGSAIQIVLDRLHAGDLVVLMDDHDGSGEGELVGAAESATPAAMSFMVRYSSGFVRVALPPHRASQLTLPPMVSGYGSTRHQYTVTVDAAEGITTGISAHDRAHTVRLLGAPGTTGDMLRRPGHTVPICGPAGGVLTSPGRVQAALDLVAVGRRSLAAYLGTVVSEQTPTRMATGTELLDIAARHGLPTVTISEVGAYLHEQLGPAYQLDHRELLMPAAGPAPTFFQDGPGSAAHLALRFGGGEATSGTIMVAVHECPWDRLFGAAYCDCAQRRDGLVTELQQTDDAVLVYLRSSDAAPRPRLTRNGSDLTWSVAGWTCAQDQPRNELTDSELDAIQALRVELGIDQFVPVRYPQGRRPSTVVPFAEPLRRSARAAV